MRKETLYTFLCASFFSAIPLLSTSGSTSTELEPEVKTVIIRPVGNQMKYDTVEIVAKAGTRLRIILENTATSPAMVHNFTLLKEATDIYEVGAAAIRAGPSNNYIPQHEAIIAYTGMTKPGKRQEIVFTVPPPGEYPYICLYPGHYFTMQGTLHVEP